MLKISIIIAIVFLLGDGIDVIHCQVVECEDNIIGDTYGSDSYSRFGYCRDGIQTENKRLQCIANQLVFNMTYNPKGYMGVIGILGGGFNIISGLYFAGKAALSVGADEVHIYLLEENLFTQTLSPDFVTHSHNDESDTSVTNMLNDMKRLDVLIIGLGLSCELKDTAVLQRVIEHFKSMKKPLILDLNECFYTDELFKWIANYTDSVVLLMLNKDEFEKAYPHIRTKNGFSEAHVDINFDESRSNWIVYRKGCTDMVFTKYPENSWSYWANLEAKKVRGQGSIITGATATYLHWAILKKNEKKLSFYDNVMLASASIYSGARLMKVLSSKIYEKHGMSSTADDMLNHIPKILYKKSDDVKK